MKKLIVSEVISQAWELTKKHWVTVLAGLLIIGVVNAIIGSIMQPKVDPLLIQQLQSGNQTAMLQAYIQLISASSVSAMVSTVVGFVLSVGFYQLLLNCVRNNATFGFGAWNQPLGVYIKVAIAGFIVSFLTFLGVCLCILPGIYIWARLQFTTYYLLDNKEAGIIDAISASWNNTSDNAFTLIGLGIVYIGLGLLGLLCCCVGVLVAEIVIYLAIVVSYIALFNDVKPQPAAEPSAKQEYTRDESSNYEK